MMIKFKLLALSALFLLVSGFDPVPVSRYEPVFMLRSEMEKGIAEGPRDIRNPGKLPERRLILSTKSTWVSM